MSGIYPGPHGRSKAVALKALEARQLIGAAFPLILNMMSPGQVGQVQKVLDAAVVNPAVKKEYDELMRKSVIAESGGYANRDPNIVNKANRVWEGMIAVGEADKRVQLDPAKLLQAGALRPRTDNPDEASYLNKVMNTLRAKGVWLHVDHKFIRNPDDPSHWLMNDPHSFQVWLTLGPSGDTIPTKTGELTREILLGTTVLGAGYYREVHLGYAQRTLDQVIKRIRNQISEGEIWHEIQMEARRDAKPGVVWVSDTLGGAKFPSFNIWDAPNKLVVAALTENVGGNIRQSSRTAMFAAFATQGAARTLDQYVSDTMRGAGRAVKILTVAKVAGEIAGALLALQGLFTGLVRIMAAEGSATAATVSTAGNVAKNRSPAAFYPTNYRGVAAYERTISQFATPATDSGFGTVVNRYDLATQQKITGWIKDFEDGVKDLYKARGEAVTGGWAVTKEEFAQIAAKSDGKWGDIMSLFADLDRLAAGM